MPPSRAHDASGVDAALADGSADSGVLPPAFVDGSTASEDGGALEASSAGDAATAQEDDAEFVDFDASQFVCNPSTQWPPGQPVAGVGAGGSAEALAITPDELQIAWVESSDAGAFSYYEAERASKDLPFGAAQMVALDGGAASPGISLSADGLRIAVVKADGAGFVQVTRDPASGAFGASVESEFQSLNHWVAALHATVSHPAFGADGQSFLYFQSGAQVTVYESRRTRSDAAPDVWPVGTPLAGAALSVISLPMEAASLAQYRYPTSLSSDGLTLFILDDYPSPTARALYRTALEAPFGASVELGNWRSVYANASCSALYYIEDGVTKISQKM